MAHPANAADRVIKERNHTVCIKAGERGIGQRRHQCICIPVHRLVQSGAHGLLSDKNGAVIVHLLGEGHAFERNVQRLRKPRIVFPHTGRVVTALKAEIEAGTVARADPACFCGKGMAHRQSIAGIINQVTALPAAHGSMHGFSS